MVTRLLTVLVVVAVAAVTEAQAPAKCFECKDIPHPADCTQVTTCAGGQTCVVTQFISSGGLVLYRSGCQSKARCEANKKRSMPRRANLMKRDDIITCDECCDGDFCNDQGCAQTALKQPARGPLCFRCDVENNPQNCRHLQACDVGSVCMLQELKQLAPDGSALYKSSCVRPNVCQAYALIGKRKRNTYCHVCCDDDYCNDRCDELITPAPTTRATPPTTTTLPTTTTTTTTPAPTTTTTTTPAPTTTTTTTTTPAPTTTTTTTTTQRPTTTTTTTEATTTTTTTKRPTTRHHYTLQERCQHYHYHYDHRSNLCYKFHYEQKTWDQGNDICKQEHGTLAIIDTQAKWEYLRDRLRQDSHSDQRWYIGGRDTQPHDDRYYWPNGARIDFEAWAHGQPNGGSDDCIYLLNDADFAWHDYTCHPSYAFICTIDMD